MNIDITISIKDEMIEEYKTALLRFHPVPLIEDLENPEGPRIPEMSENEWLLRKAKEIAKTAIKVAYNRGLSLLLRDAQNESVSVFL